MGEGVRYPNLLPRNYTQLNPTTPSACFWIHEHYQIPPKTRFSTVRLSIPRSTLRHILLGKYYFNLFNHLLYHPCIYYYDIVFLWSIYNIIEQYYVISAHPRCLMTKPDLFVRLRFPHDLWKFAIMSTHIAVTQEFPVQYIATNRYRCIYDHNRVILQ